jgi:hypothetical protein
MSILDKLSSQVGDRTESANRAVVAECIANPALLQEIASVLDHKDAALVGDCAEVLTHVASVYPDRVSPYAHLLVPLLSHKKTRVRWEAMHALALIAALAPHVIASLLPKLSNVIANDSSTIARDYAVDTVGNYGGTGKQAAEQAFPVLVQSLTAWKGKHAARALNGLANAAPYTPGLTGDLLKIAHDYLDHDRGVVRKAAKQLQKAVESV